MKKFIFTIIIALISVSNTFGIVRYEDATTFKFNYSDIIKGTVDGHKIVGYDTDAYFMLQRLIWVIQNVHDNRNPDNVTFVAHIKNDGTIYVTL